MSGEDFKKDILKANPQIDLTEIEEYLLVRKELAELSGKTQTGANYTLDTLSTLKNAGQPSIYHFHQTKRTG